ncbi:MAG: TetR/AcrR family transcriptional regulator [Caulobacteraceae bacterium]
MDDGCIKATAKDVRRQTILEMAREIFLEDGYAAASMSAIAARLGGSKGTLYNYFASKEELFKAVIQDQCDRKMTLMFEGMTAGDGDVAKGLHTLGTRYATIVLGEDVINLSRILVAEVLRFPELGKTMYEAGPLQGAQRLGAYMEKQMQAGRLRKADPRRAAEQFCELCLAGLYRQRLWNVIPARPEAKAIRDNVEAAIETFMAAFGAPGAEAV